MKPLKIKLKIKNIAVFISLFILTAFTHSQNEGDRIIAIVGNNIILESELNFQIYNYLNQTGNKQITEDIVQQIFQKMLVEKIILAKAEQDSIIITQDEIKKQTDARIKELVEQFGSEKNIENTYGITISKIRDILAEQIETSLKVNRLKQRKFGYGITVSNSEVIRFYKDYMDSIPPVPETFELYQIVRIPKITEEAKYNARKKAEEILDSIKSGADFSELARRYSDDSLSAIQGGNLGRSKRGTFVKEFEEAAYLLQAGEVSGIVETEFGYHLIKLLDKSGDFITTQHILIKFPRLEVSDFTEINLLKDIKRKVIQEGASFKEMAILYSQDPVSAKDSGYIGLIPLDQLDSAEISALKDLSEGDVSEPVRVGDARSYGYHIYFVNKRIPEHKATLETDYPLIEQYALRFKEQQLLSAWIEELKKTIYIEVKI